VSSTPDTPFFAIKELNAFYGSARALEDVSFEMGKESVAIIGRNGMGKTTLCNSIMGITPPRPTGSIRFQGEELLGKQSHAIATRGIGYVPQGRRLFPSLSVDEHLRMIRPAREIAGDGRKIVEGTPDEIRANETVHELYLGGRVTDDGIEATS
jgi:branched-chain amino acid transport system ATP-binding protein